MKYKLICTDMDGTLLNDNKVISERNKEAIKKACSIGVKVAVCTGRIFTSADFFGDVIGVKTPVIASNGAYIREKDQNRVVYKSLLGYEKSIQVLKVMKKYGIYPHFYTTDTIYTEKLIHSSVFYTKVNETLPEGKKVKIEMVSDWEKVLFENKDYIMKAVGVDKDEEKIKKVKQELKDNYDLEVVSSHRTNFEIMNKGVSKGSAVSILADFYGIKREEIITFGDSENDLSMIKHAGLGIVMGNGDEEVKKHADYITDTNEKDGVAKAIEKFILEN